MDNDKKQVIIDVAKELFVEYGFKNVTMDEIARKAGISKKTIYQHFKDKKDLVREIIFYELDRAKKQVDQILNRKDLNSIDKTIKVHELILSVKRRQPPMVIHDLERQYPDLLEEVKKFSHKQIKQAIIDNLEQGKKQGLIRQDLNSEIIAQLQINRYEALKLNQPFVENYSIETVLKEILKYHLYGITSAKGRQYIENLKIF